MLAHEEYVEAHALRRRGWSSEQALLHNRTVLWPRGCARNPARRRPSSRGRSVAAV